MAAEVNCKYLGVPLDYVYGIFYSNEKTERVRIVGPFLSLGVALTYYREKYEKKTLSAAKYAQYLLNIIDQLNLWSNPEYNSLLLNKEKKPMDRKELLQNIPNLEKTTDRFRAPLVTCLETHGGQLTRAQYEKADKTLGWPGLSEMTKEKYLENKAMEQLNRKISNKPNENPEYFLYYIDFRELPVAEAVKRIKIGNPVFNETLQLRNVHQQTQTLETGARVIWHSGQNNNKRATQILFGRLSKEDKKKMMLKGIVFVLCTPGADLKLSGTLPLQDDDWTPPKIDKGDREDDKGTVDSNGNYSGPLADPVHFDVPDEDMKTNIYGNKKPDHNTPTSQIHKTPGTPPSSPVKRTKRPRVV